MNLPKVDMEMNDLIKKDYNIFDIKFEILLEFDVLFS